MPEPESIIALHHQLDALWIRYLDLVEQYSQAQISIKKSLGQGFFSLAQANFTSSGRRYGQDYYDQRAVASVTAQIDDEGEMRRVKIITVDTVVKDTKESTAQLLPTPEPEDGEITADSKEEAPRYPTPEPEEEHGREEVDEAEHVRLPRDPLRQFGILIPPALRVAQKAFARTVRDEESIIKAINSAREMREVEVEIRKVRKVLRKAERDGGGGGGSG